MPMTLTEHVARTHGGPTWQEVLRAEIDRQRAEAAVARPAETCVRAYALTWARVPRADARKRKEQP